MKIKNKTDVAWVAGLLEGEGCFTISGNPRIKELGVYPKFCVACNMCDGDVIKRLHQITKTGHVSGPLPNGLNHRPIYRWGLTTRTHIYEFLEQILPYMGTRRSERIKQMMELLENTGQAKWRHGTRHGYENKKCKCRLCRNANNKRHRERRWRLNNDPRYTGELKSKPIDDAVGYLGLLAELEASDK